MANNLKISAVGLASLLAAAAFAQTATTVPVGFMRYTIAAGTPAAPATTAIAIPLHDVGVQSGASAGSISAVGTNTVTVTAAGWTAGALSAQAIPYALCVKSGLGEGATLVITANTDTVLTLDVTSLATLGVVVGDKFEIIPVDTLSTFFGSTTLIGGTTPTNSDVVYLMNGGAWMGYYYNTTKGWWVSKTGAPTTRNNVILQPGSGMLIERRGAAMDIVTTGTVPSMKYRMPVSSSGSTLVHTGFPTDVTLASLALPTLLPGWVSSTNVQTADWLYISNGGTWLSYYHTGAKWCTTTGPATDRGTVSIPAGSPILLLKKGSATGSATLARAMPYSL